MYIAVDAMGGDIGPSVVVRGAIEALKREDLYIYLVGKQDKIKAELQKNNYSGKSIEVIHTDESISMSDDPMRSFRNKPNSSMALAIKLVKEGKAQAVVSAGSTGAFMALCVLILGRVQGVSRPAIAVSLPSMLKPFLILDVGANTNCKPIHLYQFAIMGSIFMERVFGRANPRVALFNIGEEAYKGDKLTVKAHKLFAKSGHINFVGNIEGHSMFDGNHDVLVCDGFVGNITIKSLEGIVETLIKLGKNAVRNNLLGKIGAFFLSPTLKMLGSKIDASEVGGAPLLGVNGNCIVSHGASDYKGIMNAILTSAKREKCNINQAIEKEMQDLGKEITIESEN